MRPHRTLQQSICYHTRAPNRACVPTATWHFPSAPTALPVAHGSATLCWHLQVWYKSDDNTWVPGELRSQPTELPHLGAAAAHHQHSKSAGSGVKDEEVRAVEGHIRNSSLSHQKQLVGTSGLHRGIVPCSCDPAHTCCSMQGAITLLTAACQMVL